MKKIIMFTRTQDCTEWDVWSQIMNGKGVQPQNNSLTYKKDDITLIVKNGKTLLGEIPGYPTRGGQNPNNIEQPKIFITNLYNQIKGEKDAEILIAIHFGGGGNVKERLNSWLDYFQKNKLNNDKNLNEAVEGLLKNFNQTGKPFLTEYSIGNDNAQQINTWINNNTGNLNNLAKLYNYLKRNSNKYFSLLKHRIAHLFLPLDIDLQWLVETNFEQKNLDNVISSWNSKASQLLEDARVLLYNSNDGNKESVEKIIDADNGGGNKQIKEQRQKLQYLLPKEDNVNLTNNKELMKFFKLFESVKKLLNCISNGSEKEEEIKTFFENGNNPFHEWFVELCNVFDELIKLTK